ncbi:MAG TPA: hypothetical protein VMW73_10170 [Spirochaetia bacterium]|nr:hypothetical protein [Spirochaetia bacterium]
MLSIHRKILQRFALNSFVSGDFKRAENYFRRLKDADPDSMGADHNMGLVKMGLKQYGSAEKYLLRDLALFGETYLRSRTLGDLYYIWGKADKAGKLYSEALALEESDADEVLLRERIDICSRPDAFADVEKSHRGFEEAVRLQKAGDAVAARAALEAAVRHDPTNFLAWNNLGSILLEDSATCADAARCFSRARTYSALPSIVNNLAEARKRAGKGDGGERSVS